MSVQVQQLRLELKHPFRIAHGSSTERTNALVRIGSGVGEAALPPYYPTILPDVAAYVESISEMLEDVLIRRELSVVSIIDALPEGPPTAMAAVDMALHDVWGQRLGAPLYELFGLDPRVIPNSSYALPIPEDLDDLAEKLDAVDTFPFLKLKLGSGNPDFDEAIVRKTREKFDGLLSVDVNSGWSVDVAAKMIRKLADCDLAFIEQPISAEQIDDWHLLRRILPSDVPPLIADESVHSPENVIELAGAATGINIKLAKCGGIHMARKMIHLARALDLSVMLGCMIESSVALTAAAHLSPLVDYLDLDGQMHLASDPFTGLTFNRGEISLPTGPGLGVSPA